jgi:hypothetical protein
VDTGEGQNRPIPKGVVCKDWEIEELLKVRNKSKRKDKKRKTD